MENKMDMELTFEVAQQYMGKNIEMKVEGRIIEGKWGCIEGDNRDCIVSRIYVGGRFYEWNEIEYINVIEPIK